MDENTTQRLRAREIRTFNRRHPADGILAVADRYEDDIPLVALHRLQIFHKKTLARGHEGVHSRHKPPCLQCIVDGITLGHGEACDPKGQVWTVA
jgi:hypothetical protein